MKIAKPPADDRDRFRFARIVEVRVDSYASERDGVSGPLLDHVCGTENGGRLKTAKSPGKFEKPIDSWSVGAKNLLRSNT